MYYILYLPKFTGAIILYPPDIDVINEAEDGYAIVNNDNNNDSNDDTIHHNNNNNNDNNDNNNNNNNNNNYLNNVYNWWNGSK